MNGLKKSAVFFLWLIIYCSAFADNDDHVPVADNALDQATLSSQGDAAAQASSQINNDTNQKNEDEDVAVSDNAQDQQILTSQASQQQADAEQPQKEGYEQFLRLDRKTPGPHLYIVSLNQQRNALLALQKGNKTPLIIGGGLEFDMQTNFGNHLSENSEVGGVTNEINNGNVNFGIGIFTLAFLASINDWTEIFSSFNTSVVPDSSNTSVSAGITIVNVGNLDRSPFYLSFGSAPADFSYYEGGGLYIPTLFKSLYKPSNRPEVTLGYHSDLFDHTITIFSPQNDNGSATDFSSLWTIHYVEGNWNLMANTGYMYDLRGTGNGFDNSISDFDGNPDLTSAVNLGGHIGYKRMRFLLTSISTLQKQSMTDDGRMYGYGVGSTWAPTIVYPSTFGLTYFHMHNSDNIQAALPALNGANMYGIQNEVIAYYRIMPIATSSVGLEYTWNEAYNKLANHSVMLDVQMWL